MTKHLNNMPYYYYPAENPSFVFYGTFPNVKAAATLIGVPYPQSDLRKKKSAEMILKHMQEHSTHEPEKIKFYHCKEGDTKEETFLSWAKKEFNVTLSTSKSALQLEDEESLIADLLNRPTPSKYGDTYAQGETYAHLAAKQGYTVFLKDLLQLFPNLKDQKDEEGNTPLHCAFQLRKFKCAQQLIQEGASQLYRNKYGLLPIDYCDYHSAEGKELLSLMTAYEYNNMRVTFKQTEEGKKTIDTIEASPKRVKSITDSFQQEYFNCFNHNPQGRSTLKTEWSVRHIKSLSLFTEEVKAQFQGVALSFEAEESAHRPNFHIPLLSELDRELKKVNSRDNTFLGCSKENQLYNDLMNKIGNALQSEKDYQQPCIYNSKIKFFTLRLTPEEDNLIQKRPDISRFRAEERLLVVDTRSECIDLFKLVNFDDPKYATRPTPSLAAQPRTSTVNVRAWLEPQGSGKRQRVGEEENPFFDRGM